MEINFKNKHEVYIEFEKLMYQSIFYVFAEKGGVIETGDIDLDEYIEDLHNRMKVITSSIPIFFNKEVCENLTEWINCLESMNSNPVLKSNDIFASKSNQIYFNLLNSMREELGLSLYEYEEWKMQNFFIVSGKFRN